MRYILFTIILLFSVNTFSSGRAKYISHLTENGILYFVYPQKVPATKGAKVKSKLEYDISHLVTNDTVIFNFTVNISPAEKISKLNIRTDNGTREYTPEKIYIEEAKGLLRYRLSLQFTYAELRSLFESNSPFLMDFGNGITFSYPDKKWAKQKAEMMPILHLMEINKED